MKAINTPTIPSHCCPSGLPPPLPPGTPTSPSDAQHISLKSEDVFIRVVELVRVLVKGCEVGEVDFVAQDTTDSTKAFYELRPFLAAVADELNAILSW
jgi:hypothetical protein